MYIKTQSIISSQIKNKKLKFKFKVLHCCFRQIDSSFVNIRIKTTIAIYT